MNDNLHWHLDNHWFIRLDRDLKRIYFYGKITGVSDGLLKLALVDYHDDGFFNQRFAFCTMASLGENQSNTTLFFNDEQSTWRYLKHLVNNIHKEG